MRRVRGWRRTDPIEQSTACSYDSSTREVHSRSLAATRTRQLRVCPAAMGLLRRFGQNFLQDPTVGIGEREIEEPGDGGCDIDVPDAIEFRAWLDARSARDKNAVQFRVAVEVAM